MHGLAGLHSARAIARQRQMRAKRRAERERRLSSRTESADSISLDTMHQHRHGGAAGLSSLPENRLGASVGMLHIGVCFVALGLFFVGSGLLPDDLDFMSWKGVGWWNELVVTGLFVTALGIFLIVVNRVVSRREEEDLNEYVQRQLTRSRSGHRLERDVETGCLTTKNHRRLLEKKRVDGEVGLVPVHSPPAKIVENGDAVLEKIEESVEEVFTTEVEGKARGVYEVLSKETLSLSPGTPSETRELISNGRHNARHL